MVATAATTMRTMADGVAMTTAVAAMGGGSAAEMRRRCVAVLAVGRCGGEGRAWREGGGEGTARAARGGQRRRRGRRGEVRGGGGGGDDDDDDDHGAGVGHGLRTCLDLRTPQASCEIVKGGDEEGMSDSWERAGAAATWLTISVLLLLAPRLRAPERVKVSSLEQTCAKRAQGER